MSLAIRRLVKERTGPCALCQTDAVLQLWDSNLGAAICSECEPFLEASERVLVRSGYSHPDEFLVFRNP
jgi:hypothetical protein